MFESAKLKIERANQHITELNTLLRDFAEQNPYAISIQHDIKTGHRIFGVEMGEPVPAHVSTITGDAIHNLRTALDHMACALVVAGGGAVRSFTGFPFHDGRENFETNLERKIKGATKDAIHLFKSVEPYEGGRGDLLWRLNKVDVADKHFRLIFAVRVVSLPDIIIRNPDGSVAGILPANQVMGEGSVNLIRTAVPANFEFKDNRKPPISVVFRDIEVFEGGDVLPTLKKLPQLVLGTVETFETALS